MIRAVIFDLDNTLVDFMQMKRLAVRAAVDAMIDAGLDLEAREAEREIQTIYEREGIEYQRVFDDFLETHLGSVDPKILASGIVAYRRAREAALVLYPHVTVTLMELIKSGVRLAVVSDAPRREAWLRLCYLNLHHLFDVVVTFDDTGERKPSPAPFQAALEQLGLSAGEALMVGDWPERDVVGATQLGIRTVFARYGDTFGTVDSGADFVIDDIHELPDVVASLNAAEARGAGI
ncbi:MAG TPA: TIGR02253 family HAD-type hydrolase [Gemmatimonadota bacterium]|nr:TIGR02253 family HAD-type hydrolase [Gemmatimonadota bacterium]